MHETMYYTIGKTASDAEMPIEATTDTMAIEFSQNNINPNVRIEVPATITYTSPVVLVANTSPVRQSSGYWLNSKGKLSELIFIQGAGQSSSDATKLFYQP
jgi:hypothetical protein